MVLNNGSFYSLEGYQVLKVAPFAQCLLKRGHVNVTDEQQPPHPSLFFASS